MLIYRILPGGRGYVAGLDLELLQYRIIKHVHLVLDVERTLQDN